ncbi:MAG: 50S ribosomal protein L11 methyltransferase [Gammaproteobacteria bacterium]|nr:50S ribosomal protein L11 methyltransferase [Gammaproteobacteria bacterium]
MAWRQFVMHLGNLDAEQVETILFESGASSVTLTDAGDDPVLEPGVGETPLWTDTRIIGLFAADADLQQLRDNLLTRLPVQQLPRHHIETLRDRVWEREWLKDFGPMLFGRRLWICPTGGRVSEDDAVVVDLDPGLAFGTGTHPTTAMCLEWLDGLSLRGKTMLDYGCGSGVLAIAALKLGAAAATGMDIDPQAVIATRQNAEFNDVASKMEILGAADEISGKYDVVVANILAGPLVQFAESITLTLCDEGMLALSGVLCEQADTVMRAYEPWIDFDDPAFKEQDGQTWSRLTGKRRPG